MLETRYEIACVLLVCFSTVRDLVSYEPLGTVLTGGRVPPKRCSRGSGCCVGMVLCLWSGEVYAVSACVFQRVELEWSSLNAHYILGANV